MRKKRYIKIVLTQIVFRSYYLNSDDPIFNIGKNTVNHLKILNSDSYIRNYKELYNRIRNSFSISHLIDYEPSFKNLFDKEMRIYITDEHLENPELIWESSNPEVTHILDTLEGEEKQLILEEFKRVANFKI